MSELPPETRFLIKHGTNISDRVVNDLYNAIAEFLNGKEIPFIGQSIKLKVLGDVSRTDREYLIFDVRDIDGFDHIEFTIKKTG